MVVRIAAFTSPSKRDVEAGPFYLVKDVLIVAKVSMGIPAQLILLNAECLAHEKPDLVTRKLTLLDD